MGATVMPELPPPPPPPPPDFKGEIPKPDEKKEEKEQHFCPNCGAKVTAEDVFCGKCGKPVKEELKCVGCGTKVEPGDVFCRKCGARLVT
jgi:predicted amidophosphoribosyltransferase